MKDRMIRNLRSNASAKRVAGALGALLLVSLPLTGCGSINPPAAQGAEAVTPVQPISVRIVEAQEGPMATLLSYTGDVKPRAQVSLAAKGMGRIEELSVDIGDTVRTGEVIGHLDNASIAAQLKQAEAALVLATSKAAQMEAGTRPENVAQARANVDAARAKLAAMEEGGRPESVAQAEAALRIAEARMAQLQAGTTAEQIAEAEAAVRTAKNQLYAVQAQADAYLGSAAAAMGALIFTKEMKEAQSGAAYEQVKVAEARLAELKAGPTPEQLSQAQAAVDQARAALEMARRPYTEHDLTQVESAVFSAEQQLLLAENPYTSHDFEATQAGVAQARANVEFVKAQLADTTIVAPIDGVVAEKYLSVGALASPQSPIVSIMSTALEIGLAVEEGRADQIGVGKPVSLTVAAFPGRTFGGAVSSVAPSVDPRTRTFAIKVSPTEQEAQLKAGMFAKATIGMGERQGVLLVPEASILKRGAENSVFVQVDGKARLQRVETGATDGKNVEIKSGLAAGDKVIVTSLPLKDGDPVAAEVH